MVQRDDGAEVYAGGQRNCEQSSVQGALRERQVQHYFEYDDVQGQAAPANVAWYQCSIVVGRILPKTEIDVKLKTMMLAAYPSASPTSNTAFPGILTPEFPQACINKSTCKTLGARSAHHVCKSSRGREIQFVTDDTFLHYIRYVQMIDTLGFAHITFAKRLSRRMEITNYV